MGKWILILVVLLVCGFFIYGSRNDQLTFEEIRPLAKILLARRTECIRAELENPQEEYRKEEAELATRKAALAEAEKKVAAAQSRVTIAEKGVSGSGGSNDDDAEITRLESNIQDFERKVNQNSERIQELRKECDALDDRYNQTETVSKTRHRKNDYYTEQKYQRRQSSLSWLDYQSMKNQKKNQIRQLENSNQELERQIRQSRQRLDAINARTGKRQLDEQECRRAQENLADARQALDNVLALREECRGEVEQLEQRVKEAKAVVEDIQRRLTLEESPEAQEMLGLVEAHIWCHSLDSRRYTRTLLKVAAEPGIDTYSKLVAELSVNHYKVKSQMSSSDFARRRREMARWLGLKISLADDSQMLVYSDFDKLRVAAESVKKNYREEKSVYRKIMDTLF